MNPKIFLFFVIFTTLNAHKSPPKPESAPYDEDLAIMLYRLSGLTHCDESTLSSWSCGYACNLLQNQIEYVSFFSNNSLAGNITYVMFYDKVNQYFITAFRGTDSTEQMVDEVLDGGPALYDLHQIDGAYVTSYFYTAYVECVRDQMFSELRSAVQNYPNATFVFTGHSLGAALTTHAILDAVLLGIINTNQTFMYNYGSPRVGNYIWAQYFVETIPTIYRVVHYKDVVPHVPPCWDNLKIECTTGDGDLEQNNDGTGLEDVLSRYWHAWHVWTNIWYNENSTSYVVCDGGEDPKCADQFAIWNTNFDDHMDYFGISDGCSQGPINNTISLDFYRDTA